MQLSRIYGGSIRVGSVQGKRSDTTRIDVPRKAPSAITYTSVRNLFYMLIRDNACAEVVCPQHRHMMEDEEPMTSIASPVEHGGALTNTHIFLICALIAIVVFVIDVTGLPIGVAGGIAYVPVVVIALWLPRWEQTFIVAGGVSILTGLGFLMSEPSAFPWMIAASRLLGLSIIWLTAVGGSWLVLTKRRSADLKVRLAEQEVNSARQAKTRFLEAASNEIRHQLQTLVLLNAALGKTVDEEKIDEMLMMQGEALGHLSDLMNSLLDISEFESGDVVPRIEEVELNGILQQLEEEFTSQAKAKNIGFMIDMTTAVVCTDSTLLTQMLRSLVSNAVRYTHEGMIVVNCLREADGLRVTVRDSGVGIAPDHLANIFEEFYRVENDPAARNVGLGLGLTIVDRIVRMLGIRLHVESEPGKGSSFSLLLPVAATS